MVNGAALARLARVTCGLTLAWASAATCPATAEDAVLDEFYGSGVHQYFSGNPSQAVSDLTAAINGGSRDPRAYYFRALAELKLGQQAQAGADLQRGAALESTDVNQFYPVGKSLERVQGSARLSIERYRAIARAEAHQRQRERDALRYEQRRRAEAQVLRAPAAAPGPAPAAAGAAPGTPAPPPPPGPPVATDDPFADKPADKAEAADDAAMPADEAAPSEEPPAADSAPAEKDSDDPFGDPPAAEGDASADAEMPAEDGAEAKGDDSNPFGDEKEEK